MPGGLNANQQAALKNFLQTNSNFNLQGSQPNSFINTYLNGLNNQASNSTSSLSSGSSSMLGNGLSQMGNVANGIVGGASKVALAGFVDQLENYSGRISVGTAEQILQAVTGGLGNVLSLNWGQLIGGLFDTASAAASKFLNDLARTQAKLVEVTNKSGGFVGELGESMRNELSDALETTVQLGMTIDDFIAGSEALIKNSGRMALYSKEAITEGVLAAQAYGSSSKLLLENTEKFRNVGMGIQDAAKAIMDAGQKTLALGLNAKMLTDTLVSNIEKLNQYGFKNGIEGLETMAREAQSLGLNIDTTLKIADQLFDPAKAIDMAANLQVLGGAMGDFGDPLRMIFDVTNNVGGLQTSLINAAKSLATFDERSQTFKVTGANLRRAKMLADTFGMSMGEITNLAVKANNQFAAMSEINLIKGLDPDQKEFLKNISTLKDGKVGISIPNDVAEKFGVLNKVKDGFINLSDIQEKGTDFTKALIDYQKKIAETKPEEVARGQFNATTQILNVVNAMWVQQQNNARKSPEGQITKYTLDEFAKGVSKGRVSNRTGQENLDFITAQAKQSLEKARLDYLADSTRASNAKVELAKAAQNAQERIKQPTTLTPQKTGPTDLDMNSNKTVKIDQTVTIKGGGDAVKEVTRNFEKNKDLIKGLGIQTVYNARSFDNVQKLQKK